MKIRQKSTSSVLAVLAAAFILGCTGGTPGAIPSNPAFRDPSQSTETRVKDLLKRMTLEEKVGQVTQVARDYLYNPDDIASCALGSVLSGGGSSPRKNDPQGWLDMVNGFQRIALSTRLGIPMVYGADGVHGHNNLAGATIFPQHVGLGASGDEDLVERIGRATAIEMAATGVRWNFSPCVAVSRDERWGRAYESFSEDPALAARLGAAEIRGLQGKDAADPLSVVATAKHYLGDGGTSGGVDRGDVALGDAEFRSLHLLPYKSAVEAGTLSVMASFNSYQGLKMHGNGPWLTGVLRGELGFTGLLVSDWAGHKELPGTLRDQVRGSINAGVDMVMVPDDFRAFQSALIDLVKKGEVKEKRLDEAVSRVLAMKFRMGLFERPLAGNENIGLIGSPEHRALAREAAAKSAVLLKNEGLLPLAKKGRIAVVGAKSDVTGYQCGGWTMTWQGVEVDVPGAVSLLEAMEAAAPEADIVYSRDGTRISDCDAAIVVVGEKPYAEMKGDDQDLELEDEDKAMIARVAKAGVPMAVVLYSGRPMIVNEALGAADAFIAAWLPGSEAGGVADVIFGDRKPSGKLSFSWPASVKDLPLNAGDGKKALFPFGYGLEYRK